MTCGGEKAVKKDQIFKEVIGGFTTFLTMSYIVVVNPQIISTLGTGVSSTSALCATVCLTVLMTLIAGLFIRLPYAVGPGMGLNSFVVFTLAIGKHVPWPTAMGITLISGTMFLIISLTSLRAIVIDALPYNLKQAITAGIGFLLVYIGLRNMGLLVAHPVTFIKLGEFTTTLYLALVGLVIAFYLFWKKKSKLNQRKF